MSEEEIIEILKELISWRGKHVEVRDYEIEAIQGLLVLYKKQQNEIEELKQDNAKQWEERCRLTFKLQEAEERLSQIELQILEED